MKLFSLAAFAVLALASSSLAQTAIAPGAVKLTKLLPAVVKSPEFQLVGGLNKRYKNREWLEIEVEYATTPEEIDELTFKFTVEVESKLLDGETTYILIPKEREHYGVVYVAPRTLEKLTGGKPLTNASIQNVWVTVTHSGQVLGETSFKPDKQPNLPHIPNLVLNKDQTPFAPLYYDRYEVLKPSTR
jgi:hypothetical protein